MKKIIDHPGESREPKNWIPAFAGMTFLIFFSVFPVHALKKGGHVKASLVSEVKSIQPGTPFWVALRLEMQPHWHTYWQNPGDSGEPTSLTWQLPEGFKAGDIMWPRPSVISIPPVLSYGYENEVLLLVRIQPPAVIKQTAPITLKATADWLECEVVCIPGTADVSLTLPLKITPPEPDNAWLEKFSMARFEWPVESADWSVTAFNTPEGFRLSVARPEGSTEKLSELYFFAADPNAISYAPPQKFSSTNKGATLDLVKSEASTSPVTHLRGILVNANGWRGPNSERSLLINAPISGNAPAQGGMTLWLALIFSFIGGIILNLMPCVLPVLSIKILGFIKQAQEDRATVLRHGFVFTAGVVASFWVLAGVLIFLRAGGQQLGWGFQLQSPIFVGALAALFFVMGLSLIGLFEIGTSLIQLADTTQQKSGYTKSFLSGVLATVVATPCTAPFMGPALGVALTLPAFQSILIFTSLGLGMSSPYLILSANPGFLRFVPKPGPWMDKFKKIMGLLFLATTVWLVWVLNTQIGFLGPKSVATGKDAHGIDWEPYSKERVEELRESGRAVFVDFTAAWCLTCQVNERVALSSEKVVEMIKQKNIATLKADWTSHDEKITQALASFGRSGVPFYILYPADPNAAPVTLPEILTPQIVLDGLSKV